MNTIPFHLSEHLKGMRRLLLPLLLAALPAGAQQYDWRTFAGNAGGPGRTDGGPAEARFLFPGGVDRDVSGNLYVADHGNHTIRLLTPAGVVSTFAGVPGQGGSVEVGENGSVFNRPGAIAVDTVGRYFIADTENHTIRALDGSGGWRVVAGEPGVPGTADGFGNAARFNRPVHLVLDSGGNAYVTDSGNHAIRKVVFGCCGPVAGGAVTTFAGKSGERGAQDGAAAEARFDSPVGAVFDVFRNLVVADSGNHTLRLVAPDGTVTTLAGMPGVTGHVDGTGSAVRFGNLSGIANPDGWGIFVTDSEYHTLRRVWHSGIVTTMAGSPGVPGWVEGTGAAARFRNPAGLAADRDGNVWIADAGNHALRKFTGSGVVSTVAGAPQVSGSSDGSGAAARFSGPAGIAVDSVGVLYVADSANHLVRRITPDGAVTTLAGSAGSAGSDDGTGAAARFRAPAAVAVTPDGSVLVADRENHTIRRITPGGEVTTLAGLAATAGWQDAGGNAARFSSPSAIAVDRLGTAYVADTGNHRIRRIMPDGVGDHHCRHGQRGQSGRGRPPGFLPRSRRAVPAG